MKGNTMIAIALAATAAVLGGGMYYDAQREPAPPGVTFRDVTDPAPCSMLTVDRKGDTFERVTVDFVCITQNYPGVPVYVRQPDPAPAPAADPQP